jgi:peroxiredoxin Q/BCP
LTGRSGGGHNRLFSPAKGRSVEMKAMCLVVAVGLMLACAAARAADLAPGDPAPEFSLPGSDGKVHKLSDYKGKDAVVLAWFPKAFTGG